MVGVNGSVSSYHAVAWAAVEARLHRCELRLVESIAAATPDVGPCEPSIDLDPQFLQYYSRRTLAEAIGIVRGATGSRFPLVTAETVDRPIIDELLGRSHTARMIVLGRRSLAAVDGGLVGSVGATLIQRAHCPIAVTHTTLSRDTFSATSVLAGVGRTTLHMPALGVAFEEAALREVGLTIVHMSSETATVGGDTRTGCRDSAFAAEIARWAARYPQVTIHDTAADDSPVQTLLDETDNAQLLVIGGYGPGGFADMLIGSSYRTLANMVDCPFIVVTRPIHPRMPQQDR
ncbi:universal stress protein [Nocardia sp. BMG111209]|uniref:universal stress protein n=1 Tax=Nocardia sp. BMG111209 TaxID=1160137 RepID=UPI0018C8E1D0|nr:universal stress protein [Nocardia sp. BMG111209]